MVQPTVPLEAVRATAERVVRLAHAVYGGVGADVVWREGRGHSRTRPFKGDTNTRFPSRHVIATAQPLWIADFATDPTSQAKDLAPGSPEVKAFLGVPIISDGKVLGALIAIDVKVRPHAEKVVRHFEALASLLGDDYARVKMANELKSALEESARSERRLRAAMRIAKIRVWELDHARREAVNEQQRRDVVDYDAAMRNLWAPVHPDDLPVGLAAWDAHLAGGPPLHLVQRHVRQDGTMHWVESVAEAVRDETGEVIGAVGAVRNIDQEKRNELDLIEARQAAESANEAKSLFLATVSHEIRTPLNGVYGMAQAMAKDDLPADQRQRLEVICRSSESLLAIVNDVLDLSRSTPARSIWRISTSTPPSWPRESWPPSPPLPPPRRWICGWRLSPPRPGRSAATRAACVRCCRIWSPTPSNSRRAGRWSFVLAMAPMVSPSASRTPASASRRIDRRRSSSPSFRLTAPPRGISAARALA
jgi:PAS domain-containing protein